MGPPDIPRSEGSGGRGARPQLGTRSPNGPDESKSVQELTKGVPCIQPVDLRQALRRREGPETPSREGPPARILNSSP